MVTDDNIVKINAILNCLNNALIALNNCDDDIDNLDCNIPDPTVCAYITKKYEAIEDDIVQLSSWIKRTNWSK